MEGRPQGRPFAFQNEKLTLGSGSLRPMNRARLIAAASLVALIAACTPSAIAASGDIYVGQFSPTSKISRVTPAGAITTVTADPLVGDSYGLDFAPDGSLFAAVSDSPDSRIARVDPLSGAVTPVHTGAPLENPSDIEFGPDGNAYITDFNLDAVFRLTPAGALSTFGQTGSTEAQSSLVVAPSGVVYVGNYDGKIYAFPPQGGTPTVAATIDMGAQVSGMDLTPSGQLIVSDIPNSRLLRVDPSTGAAAPIASVPAINSSYNLALLPDGGAVFGDYSDNRLVRVDTANGAQSFIGDAVPDVEGITVEPPVCRKKPATIVGSTGPDVLAGSVYPDVIAALGGNDVIRGLQGNDVVCGGTGNDRLLGAKGRDTLVGEAGKDKLFGGGGRDRLLGGKGKDKLAGGKGKDKLRGGAGKDAEKQ